jgi:hypothetical protein
MPNGRSVLTLSSNALEVRLQPRDRPMLVWLARLLAEALIQARRTAAPKTDAKWYSIPVPTALISGARPLALVVAAMTKAHNGPRMLSYAISIKVGTVGMAFSSYVFWFWHSIVLRLPMLEVSFNDKDAEDETKDSDGWDAYAQDKNNGMGVNLSFV